MYMNEPPKGPNQRYAEWLEDVTFHRRDEKKSKQSWNYIGSVTRQLMKNQDNFDILEFIPAEPYMPVVARIASKKKGKKITTEQYSRARLDLINARIINYVKMSFKKHDGTTYKITPHFLNPLGKYYYGNTFATSPDTMSMGFYHNNTESREFSVRHIEFLKNYYKNKGYDVELGSYPFDLIIDGKHGFVLTEMHENSIGIEIRLAEAMKECVNKNMTLYCPAISMGMMKRVSAIIAGLIYYSEKVDHFAYVTYHEAEICSDVKTENWSYYLTRTNDGDTAELPEVIEFPKIDVNSHNLVLSQLKNTSEKRKKKNLSNWYSYMYEPVYINNLKNYEIAPHIKVTVGLDYFGMTWRRHAMKSSAILTGKCRQTMTDYIREFPDLLVADNKADEQHNKTIDIFKEHGSEVIYADRNHAKAVLDSENLIIHSMATTSYMGNKRESYIIINFEDHPLKDMIHSTFYNMIYYLGQGKQSSFIHEWKKIKPLFKNRLGILANFHGKTTKWPYYGLIKSAARQKGIKIYTSHLDIKKLASLSAEIRIQGVSRLDNHKSLMVAKCPIYKERMWHPRLIFNSDFVALGSWDMAHIKDQKELQAIVYLNDELIPGKKKKKKK
ncbi:hypothetical protein Metev_0155 [Methanohalobium evestigatum Z-7303]|uniref:Uncharacterized protein n=1 Tax=Methanohalobium evestigatum (strain ATCC BAA-1072 / DSM 3721 / NBRC 107634 / OCM 161 / Z-7303) TaxID=644295 RepID=D7E664_METEZ|nr:hypothetical protein [Methanohalobium evestigatum]ADI73086.1 hypothetical protein Metev_0155 [Methanohalobium evestigatum Z-7303]